MSPASGRSGAPASPAVLPTGPHRPGASLLHAAGPACTLPAGGGFDRGPVVGARDAFPAGRVA